MIKCDECEDIKTLINRPILNYLYLKQSFQQRSTQRFNAKFISKSIKILFFNRVRNSFVLL
jgi:hypothetical protein